MKLIGLIDLVLDQKTLNPFKEVEERLSRIYEYAQLLKQPIELWMFLPCDEEGNVLKEPEDYQAYLKYGTLLQVNSFRLELCKEYQKGLDRILFKNFRTHPLNPDWINFHRGIRIYYPHNDLEHYWSFVFDRDNGFKTIRFGKYETIEDLCKFNLELTGNHLK